MDENENVKNDVKFVISLYSKIGNIIWLDTDTVRKQAIETLKLNIQKQTFHTTQVKLLVNDIINDNITLVDAASKCRDLIVLL